MATRSLKQTVAAASFLVCTTSPAIAGVPENGSPTLEKLEGYVATGNPLFLQFYDAVSLPGNGATNFLREVMLQPTDGFLWQYMDEPLWFPNLQNGLILCLSTTQGSLTTGGTSTFYVELEEWEQINLPGLTVSGDLVSSETIQQVWTEAGGPQAIVKIEIVTITGTPCYVQIFTTDTVGIGFVPNFQLPLQGTTGTKYYRFGPAGWVPHSQDKSGKQRVGCSVALSGTSMVYDGTINGCIRVTFIPQV